MSKAIVFAGQGAQFVGMGKDLAEAYPVCRDLFARADEVLGYGLSAICFEGPAEELTKTNHCQPGIFVASAACYEALRQECPDVSFAASAGLSLGEWTALYAAGVLSLDDTLRVLEARGRFMQDACDKTDGAMLSVIGLPVEKVRELSDAAGTEVANLNSDGQTVLSGEREAIERATELAREARAKRALQLKVAGAYHSSLMQSARDRLAEVLKDITFKSPSLPVIANVTGKPHTEPDAIRETMLAQVTSTVRWQAGVEAMLAQGVDTFVECGPGKVLSGLIRRIDKQVNAVNVQDTASLDTAKAALA